MLNINTKTFCCVLFQTSASPPARIQPHQQHGLLHAAVKPSAQPSGQHLPQTADDPVARWPRAQFTFPNTQDFLQQLRQPLMWPSTQPGGRPEERSAPQGAGGQENRQGDGERQGQSDGDSVFCGVSEERPRPLCSSVSAIHPGLRPSYTRQCHIHHHQHSGREERSRGQRRQAAENMAAVLFDADGTSQRLSLLYLHSRTSVWERGKDSESVTVSDLHTESQLNVLQPELLLLRRNNKPHGVWPALSCPGCQTSVHGRRRYSMFIQYIWVHVHTVEVSYSLLLFCLIWNSIRFTQ